MIYADWLADECGTWFLKVGKGLARDGREVG